MMWRVIGRVSAWMCLVCAVVLSVRVRFGHPELTETQLMLTFWREWLFIGVLCAVAFVSLTLLQTRAK